MSKQISVSSDGYTKDQVELIKRTICKGASDDELQMFMYQCNKVQLDPFSRQIWSVERQSKNPDNGQWEKTRTCQVSIDGLRLIADRTGKYEGQTEPQWCGIDGKWVDVWVKKEPPSAARVGVFKSGFKAPLYSIARYESYCQKKKDGVPTRFWSTMPDLMLSKCAESLALRKAFPLELSGLYSSDEMGQTIELMPEKNEPIRFDIDNLKRLIVNSTTLEELKENFSIAYRFSKETGDENLSKDLLMLKDAAKEEIELILSKSKKQEMSNESL